MAVREGIKEQLGDAIEIMLWPEALKLHEGNDTDAEVKAQSKAHKWLKAKRCDLLLWGRVKDAKVLSLRFTGAGANSSGHASYALAGETLDVPDPLVADLGAAIAAQMVESVASVFEKSGHYLTPIMRELLTRLEPILRQPNPHFTADTRGALAVTQENLGNALLDLGKRANDAGRLGEAATAYREMLKEKTRERMPLAWATVQANLGSALASLGELDGGTTHLEEAIAAYLEALEVFRSMGSTLAVEQLNGDLARAKALLAERNSNGGF